MFDKAHRLYVLRSLLAPRVSWRWSRFIRDLHRRVGADAPAASVLVKPLRNYMLRDYWPQRRLSLLVEHYLWFRKLFSDEFARRLLSNEEIEVVSLRSRNGGDYRVYIAASVVAILPREGEIAIYLARQPDALRLCRLSFSLTRVERRLALVIGGVHGPLAADERAIIDATRDLHGLRPKDAVLLATRAFARALSLSRVHAVGDAGHVLRRPQDNSKVSRYDAYWLERGAVEGGPFGYVFGPLEPVEPTGDRREAAQIAIVEGVEAFVRGQRRGIERRRA